MINDPAQPNRFVKHNLFGEGNSENPVIEFAGIEELMSKTHLGAVSQLPSFSHFAISGNCLMSISDGGYSWWVLGYVDRPSEMGLPEWDKGKTAVIADGEPTTVLGRDVRSYCGDDVTMNDGRVYKKDKCRNVRINRGGVTP